MKFSTLISFLILSIFSYAQFEQTVIGSQGGTETVGTNTIEYTVGEAVILTLPSNIVGGNYLTQGFHQPKSIVDANQIDTMLSIFDASCVGVADGMFVLDSVAGCDTGYIIALSSDVDNFDAVVTVHDTVFNLSIGSYTLKITANNGLCSQIFQIEIGVTDEDCELYFYNAFSPNDDFTNDTWTISHVESFSDNTIQIFDRWGVLTWKTTGYDNLDKVWKGKNMKGVSVPDGTYYYLFKIEGIEKLYKGYIEITR